MPPELPRGANIYFPRMQQKRQRRRTLWISIIAIVVLYAVFLGILFLIFRVPFLRVQNISVTGNVAMTPNDVISAAFTAMHSTSNSLSRHWLSMSNMLWWPSQLNQEQLTLTPQLTHITIEKNYRTHEIVLDVTERQPYGIWCREQQQPEQCFWFDNQGFIFARALSAEGSLVPVIHDYSNNVTGIDSYIIPQELIPNLLSVMAMLKQSGLPIEEVRLNDLGLQEIEVDTFNGPTILFSLRFPADNLLAALQALESSPGLSKLQQIDFRVQNRVYYQ